MMSSQLKTYACLKRRKEKKEPTRQHCKFCKEYVYGVGYINTFLIFSLTIINYPLQV